LHVADGNLHANLEKSAENNRYLMLINDLRIEMLERCIG
jgi:hypothetical protein